MRLILVGDKRVGCVGLRAEPDCLKIDSFYLERQFHNSGLGSAILKVLLAEADAVGKPVRLEVLNRGRADRFYLRHGFVKLGEDEIEGECERPAAGA
jgi:GNAT superfamily N-acetyltransferase